MNRLPPSRTPRERAVRVTHDPSFTERLHGSAHLYYEVDQLSAMYFVLARIEAGDDVVVDIEVEETVRLALMEALLGHARCVIEFLAGRPPRGGTMERSRKPVDIPPTWFASSWVAPEGVDRLDRWLSLIDRNVAHLSLSRIRADELDDHSAVVWTGEMFHEIAEELDRYVAAVDDQAIQDTLRRSVAHLHRGLVEYPDLVTGS